MTLGLIAAYLPATGSRVFAFYRTVATMLEEGDGLLLGVDLVKDEDTLVAAYDDSAGVTAEFNKNILRSSTGS